MRACCCLSRRSGYSASPSAEQHLLSRRHPAPLSSATEAPPSPPRISRPERQLLQKGQSRSDERSLELFPEETAAATADPNKKPTKQLHSRAASLLSLADEDCCPTCLEAYTADNPRVTANCGHSYHVQCAYAWLERSETCPMCGRQMECEDLQFE